MRPRQLPLVSIVVPSWRQGRYLRQCLSSLLGQGYPNLEILVRDNLSDDGTAAILEEFAPRLGSLVRERDHGQSDALRKGFQQARGEILGWLNVDDMLMPGAVASVVEAFLANPRADVVYGHCAFLDGRGAFLRYFDDIQGFSKGELVNYNDFLAQPSTFFRRGAYEAVGGIDPSLHFAMDWDLWCRFARAGREFVLLPRVLSAARLYPGTKTTSGGLRRMLEITRVNARHKTTALPMVPILYLAHLHSTWLKPWIGPLHRPLQRAWRAVAGRREVAKAVVNGVRAPTRVVEPAFRIELPVYEPLSAVRLWFDRPRSGGPRPAVEARLDGRPPDVAQAVGSRLVLEWRLAHVSPTEALRIEGVVDRTPTTLDFGVELLAAPSAPHAAAEAAPARLPSAALAELG